MSDITKTAASGISDDSPLPSIQEVKLTQTRAPLIDIPPRIIEVLNTLSHTNITGVPKGYDALVLTWIIRVTQKDVLHISPDNLRLTRLVETIHSYAPDITVFSFPSWENTSYEGIAPSQRILSQRANILRCLVNRTQNNSPPYLICTTASAVLQRLPLKSTFLASHFILDIGTALYMVDLVTFLECSGYYRKNQVSSVAEYSIHDNIVDIFPPGTLVPLRLEMHDTKLTDLHCFNPTNQCTCARLSTFTLWPASELLLDHQTFTQLYTNHKKLFSIDAITNLPYKTTFARYYLPNIGYCSSFLHNKLETIFAYVPDGIITLNPQSEEARQHQLDLVFEHFKAHWKYMLNSSCFVEKKEIREQYRLAPPALLYIMPEEWIQVLSSRKVVTLSPKSSVDPLQFDAEGQSLKKNFDVASLSPDCNIFDFLRSYIDGEQRENRKVIIAAPSANSCDYLFMMLCKCGINTLHIVETLADVADLPVTAVAMIVLDLEISFTTPTFTVISAYDIRHQYIEPPSRNKMQYQITDLSITTITEGDLVVHIDHGIGQYGGLVTLSVDGVLHDCLLLLYEGGDRLFVPVENIDVLSRYGSEITGVQCDTLGSLSWPIRKNKLRQHVRKVARKLVHTTAIRRSKKAEILVPFQAAYDDFCDRFPYIETDDQSNAIADVLADLASGYPMDRLVCGDVGFGKTEVALRAVFTAALSGVQVAIIVPTTLLAQQHYRTFSSRFSDLPVQIASLSRLTPKKEASLIRQGLADGQVDIVIGTHALLTKNVSFKRLGLLVIDEEQHFGVVQKEKLKRFQNNIHVLTLTATPIPRTLQLSLSGARELSLLTSPPVDRLAVQTSVLPFDPRIIKEAILYECLRGGQTFYVCPRIVDLEQATEFLEKLVPEVSMGVAHGRMSDNQLEDIISAFSRQEFRMLICTNIIESGLDMPLVNTVIVYRADLFGLGQLYQLRGRVGRSRIQAYAYLTTPPNKILSQTARKRLSVMQALDTLGTGFTLANYDLDIRGSGNLLGKEQSGHVREVGIGLYQHLLEREIAAIMQSKTVQDLSPQVTIGIPVLIPKSYISDSAIHLALYQHAATLVHQDEISNFASEITNRFGPPPQEVINLFTIISLRALCKRANIDRLDAGPKGIVLSFQNNTFQEPEALVLFIMQHASTMRVKPDRKVVITCNLENLDVRTANVHKVLEILVSLAEGIALSEDTKDFLK